MIYESDIEKSLVETGYDNLDLMQKNTLITTLARRYKLVYSEVTEEYILKHAKKLKITLLDEKCDNAILLGFKASNGHTYRSNRDDQVNMIGQMLELQFSPEITEVAWKTEDAGYIVHPKDEWVVVFKEALYHKRYQLFKYDVLRQKIELAKTHAELVSVSWESEVDIEFPVRPGETVPESVA